MYFVKEEANVQLQPNYIVDNQDHKIAVQIDIDTYEKITEVLENYALYKLIENNQKDEKLSLEEAKSFYHSLKQKNAN